MIEAPAQCPVHPGQPSIGTCERCGRFICPACRIGGTRLLCRDCGALVSGPEAVMFRPFDVANAVTGALSLLRATAGRVVLANLPFAVATGFASAVITRATGAAGAPFGASKLELLSRVYGATLLITIFSTLVNVAGAIAGIALMAEAVNGSRLGVADAWRRAFKVWGRAAWVNLGVVGQTFLFSLACGIPGIWRAVCLVLVNASVLLEPGQRPLQLSDERVRPRFWPVLAVILIGALVVIVPIDVFVFVFGIVARVKFLPPGGAAAISGFGSELGRALFCAFVVSIFYGIRASEPAQR